MNRICTILAMNYLPQAIALEESIRKVYPEIDFYVLVIDSFSRDISYLPSATILLPEDLLIPPDWLTEMRSYYDAMELATSLKPFLLKTLLDDTVETVTYLDPDILLFDTLHEGIEGAKDFGIALTPHRLTPSNILAPLFLELVFLRYGVFNLGYITVGQKSKAMLDWWGSRLRWYSTKFPNDPAFTDQKWINLIPALYSFKLIQSGGYNLASWNLDERPLTIRNKKIFVGTEPLVFIHFAQMSSVLVAGGKTDHWKQTLEDSQDFADSLQIVTELTDEYSRKLVAFALTIRLEDKTGFSDFQLSYHTKKALINKSLKSVRVADKVQEKPLNFKSVKLGQRLKISLERSSALNGFRDGLRDDLNKFRRLLGR